MPYVEELSMSKRGLPSPFGHPSGHSDFGDLLERRKRGKRGTSGEGRGMIRNALPSSEHSGGA